MRSARAARPARRGRPRAATTTSIRPPSPLRSRSSSVDLARVRGPAAHRREIVLLQRATLELARERGVDLRPLREEEDAARVAIEALVNAEIRIAAAITRREEGAEAHHDVVGAIGVRSLARHTGGLVHRDEVIVLVEDVLLSK